MTPDFSHHWADWAPPYRSYGSYPSNMSLALPPDGALSIYADGRRAAAKRPPKAGPWSRAISVAQRSSPSPTPLASLPSCNTPTSSRSTALGEYTHEFSKKTEADDFASKLKEPARQGPLQPVQSRQVRPRTERRRAARPARPPLRLNPPIAVEESRFVILSAAKNPRISSLLVLRRHPERSCPVKLTICHPERAQRVERAMRLLVCAFVCCLSFRSGATNPRISSLPVLLFVIPQRSGGICFCRCPCF